MITIDMPVELLTDLSSKEQRQQMRDLVRAIQDPFSRDYCTPAPFYFFVFFKATSKAAGVPAVHKFQENRWRILSQHKERMHFFLCMGYHLTKASMPAQLDTASLFESGRQTLDSYCNVVEIFKIIFSHDMDY